MHPDPEPCGQRLDQISRQLEALDPSVVVTLGRFSMATFMPGVRITQAHGTTRLADPATGARDATVFAMYHPAYALRNPAVERESYDDMALIPGVLVASRERRAANRAAQQAAALAATAAVATTATTATDGVPIDPASTADRTVRPARSSSRMRSKTSTLASNAMPMVRMMPAMPGRVSVALK